MGRPPRIDREGVVRAAISVLDTEGPGALSLDRLATELDVSAPSLYYHYADKSAILDAVAAEMLSDLGVPDDLDDWRELLVAYSHAFYRRVAEHPNVIAVLIEHLPKPAVLYGYEQNARALAAAGVPTEACAPILESVQHFVWGFSLYAGVGVANPAFSEKVDAEHYPAWAEALAVKSLSDSEVLSVGVRAVIEGLMSQLGCADTRPTEITA